MKEFIERNRRQKEMYLSKETTYKIIEELKKEIQKHKEDFIKTQEIDQKYYDQVLNINILLEILNISKEKEISSKKEKDIIITTYTGNPYITVNLFCYALTQKKAIALAIEGEMYATNKVLVEIFKTVLERYKIVNLVELFENKKIDEIIGVQDLVNEVICIGNSNSFYVFRKNKIKNLRYISFNNMAIYTEEEKYLELRNNLYDFALINGLEVENYCDVDIEEFIECMNIDETVENVVVFTQDLERAEQIRNSVKNKRIFINENPFKNEKFYLEDL